jgi:hypothetical protein
MLVSHLNAIEQVLIARSKLAANAGHPNLRGGPREWFVKEFLESHLPSAYEIGQGEIINADSRPHLTPRDYRNQVDLVIYRRNFPKISYSLNDTAFLIEGVVATLETKSKLTKDELRKACEASKRHKSLSPESAMGLGLRAGDQAWIPSHIVSYTVAFDGPTNIATIGKWLPEIATRLKAKPEQLVEMIVVLGKGVIWRIDAFPSVPISAVPDGRNWAFVRQRDGNLFALFAHMLTIGSISSSPPGILGYVKQLSSNAVRTV